MVKQVNCIDVSEHQGDINWAKVKACDIAYAFLRAGYGRSASQIDKCFERNYKNAKKAGVKVGVYWYSYADSVEDAKREAEACLEVLKGKTLNLPVFFDLEESFQTAFSKSTLTTMAKMFCETIRAGGFTPGVYANLTWFENHLDYRTLKKLYPIWLAQYHIEAQLDCDVWQYSSKGSIPGVSGYVDMNIIYNEKMMKEGETMTGFEIAGVQALLRQAYAQGIVKTFVKPIDNKAGKLTKSAIIEAKAALGDKNPDSQITLEFISNLEHLVNVRREENFAKARGDVNKDGKVNIKDATALQKQIADNE